MRIYALMTPFGTSGDHCVDQKDVDTGGGL
jgi:hypothetical protein